MPARHNTPTPPGPVAAPPRAGGSTGVILGITLVVGLGGFLFGYDSGVISGALSFVTDDFHLSAGESGLVVSSILVGAMAGALGSGRLADRFGRRSVIIGAAAVFTVGAVLAALSPSVAVLIAARVVLGLGIGIASALVPVFIAEVAPPAARGRLVAVNQLLITIGIVAAYAVGYAFTNSHNWRAMFAIGVVPAVALGVGMLFLPESPRWLISRGREAEARRVLTRIRHAGDVDEELTAIRQVRPDGGVRLRELGKRWMVPALLAGIGLQVLGQATGVNTVIYYAPTIFKHAGLGASAAILATVGIGIVNMVMTAVGMSLVDRIGRRRLLMTGVSVMTLALVALALTLTLSSLSAGTGVVAFVCVAIYIAAVAASLDVVVFIIPSEIYPLRVRGTAMSVTLFSNWGMNFLVSLTFLTLLQALGTAGTFWLYAALCAVLVVFTAKFIPETKGRTLEQIEAELHQRTAA
ncbi:sugar porter family MFS transporter [Streptomyces montanisoli]|uniref:Sugar porter family MFS transporter n=1 Tax=Streptomyces montanisoli TaxID=2798581 RepID=A0A940RUW2_9ACTN|nr:sugar porter family MFS transporter [Streptomyces montanisoli]MBP0457641.1 sugar porter family MFS transporter [Streptomyces montanisoli]